ncbi:MAG: sigma-70 family RNA polymerase sigma factor [Deltaproteobacteria bacterium]|nr:sigma-70 family RNA polymerase sigma factor [Deltaproteobacteria bacterium]
MGNREVGPDEAPSYEMLHRAHYARVLQLCRLLLVDRQEAEDVTQEVFLRLFREYEAQSRPIAWGPWLTRVTVNACRDRRRSGWWRWWRDRDEAFQEAGYPSRDPTPEEWVSGREQRERIWHSFRGLSSRQREVFVLRYAEEWSTEEIAKALGLTAGSVKRHLFRAVRHVRKAVGDR